MRSMPWLDEIYVVDVLKLKKEMPPPLPAEMNDIVVSFGRFLKAGGRDCKDLNQVCSP